jgi:hypothetical protein
MEVMSPHARGLTRVLGILRIIYAVLLVPMSIFGSFALFMFLVTDDKNAVDFLLFLYATGTIGLTFAAVFLTGRLIQAGRPWQALGLYVAVPVLLAPLVISAVR